MNNDERLQLLSTFVNCSEDWFAQQKSKLSSFVTTNDGVEAIQMSHLTQNQLNEFLATLKSFPKLSCLVLTHCTLQKSHIIQLSEALVPTHIHRLDLSHNTIEQDATKSLYDLLATLNRLKRLSLSCIQPFDKSHSLYLNEALSTLKHCFYLTRFNLSNNQIDKNLFDNFFYSLSQQKGLTSLRLSGNCLDSTSLELLAQYIPLLKKLEYLNLNNNLLGGADKELEKFVDALMPHENLGFLYLDGNGFTRENFAVLLRLLYKTPSLKLLSLNDNCIGTGFIALVDLMKGNLEITLRCLELRLNHIPARVIDLFTETLKTVKPNYSFEISLGNNSISVTQAAKLLSAYVSNNDLEMLQIDLQNCYHINPNSITNSLLQEFRWVNSQKIPNLVSDPVVNLTIIGSCDETTMEITNLLKKKSFRESLPIFGHIMNNQASSQSILNREAPRKLHSKSPVSISLIQLKHENFVHYHSLLCITSSRLIFVVADDPSVPLYQERLYSWIRFIACAPGESTILLALRIHGNLPNMKTIKREMRELITRVNHEFKDKTNIDIHYDPVYFQDKEKAKFQEVIETCALRVVKKYPNYLPEPIINLMTQANTTNMLKKVMLMDTLKSTTAKQLNVGNFEAIQIIEKLTSAKLIIAITRERICTDLSWFYQAIINSLLNPDAILAIADTINFHQRWFVSDTMLSDCKELREQGADFPGFVAYVCKYLSRIGVWHKMQTNFDTDTYFHPIMLPRETIGDNTTSRLTQVFEMKGFTISRRLIPTGNQIIPPNTIPNLQCKLYETLCDRNRELVWKYQFTQNGMTFEFLHGGFHIRTPQLNEFRMEDIPKDCSAFAFLDIYVSAPSVAGACFIYYSIMESVKEILSSICWMEYCIPAEIATFRVPTSANDASAFLSTQQLLQESQTSKEGFHHLIPDLLAIDARSSRVSYSIDYRKRILLVEVSLVDVFGKPRNISEFDLIHVAVLPASRNAPPIIAELKHYDASTGKFQYHAFLQQSEDAFLICTPLGECEIIGKSPIFIPASGSDTEPGATPPALPEHWDPESQHADFFKLYKFNSFAIPDSTEKLFAAEAILAKSEMSDSSTLLTRTINVDVDWFILHPIAILVDALQLLQHAQNSIDIPLKLERKINVLAFQHDPENLSQITNFRTRVLPKVLIQSYTADISYFFFRRGNEIYVGIISSASSPVAGEICSQSKLRKLKNFRKTSYEAFQQSVSFVGNNISKHIIDSFGKLGVWADIRACDIHIFGHAFGGSIATHVCRNIIKATWKGNIYCFTFGAPHVGEPGCTLWPELTKPNVRMLHFICDKDPISKYFPHTEKDCYESVDTLFVFDSVGKQIDTLTEKSLTNFFTVTSQNIVEPDELFHSLSFYMQCVLNLLETAKTEPDHPIYETLQAKFGMI